MTERRRRRHPARGARIITAGLSAAAVLGITATLGFARQPAAAPPASGGPAAAPAPTVPGVRPATPAPFATTPHDATTHGSR